MTTFMSPPPASTFLAFHPQDNNIIAIGMEDSTIHIYNVRVDEVKLLTKIALYLPPIPPPPNPQDKKAAKFSPYKLIF